MWAMMVLNADLEVAVPILHQAIGVRAVSVRLKA